MSPLGGLPLLPFTEFKSPGDAERFTAQWAGWFSTAQIILQAASGSGATNARPTQGQFVGMPYFDTTLGIPIWLKTPGAVSVWVDATGAPV